MDLEKRREKLLKRIEELGIIHMCDVNTLEDMESACDSVEQFEKEYPSEILEFQHDLITKHRDWVWKLDEKFQRYYFNNLIIRLIRFLWKENIPKEEIEKFFNDTFSGEKYYNSFK
jgi:hypothetical protein